MRGMTLLSNFRGGRTCLLTLALLSPAGLTGAQTEAEAPLPVRTQVLELSKGWNAVWLEGEPLDATPEKVFASTPVDICARYFRPVTSTQFIKNPTEAPWNEEGWGVWYAPRREDAVLKSLHRIEGNTGYLVYSTAPYKWSLPGKVRHHVYQWKNEAYTLAGFSVDPQSPPTFASFFAGSAGKTGSSVYRLEEGRWQRIEDLTRATLRNGEACWIFASGDTTYQGPLKVDLGGVPVADFGGTLDLLNVRYVNTSGASRSISMEVVPATSTAAPDLPLLRRAVESSTLTTSTSAVTGSAGAPLAPGYAGRITLQVGRETMTAPRQTALVQISDGAGTIVRVPVRAQK